MRDYVLTAFIFGTLFFVFKRPWLGVLLWTWIGIMTPHRLCWSFAYSMPFAAIVGGVTLIALLASKEPKRYPLTPVTITLILLIIWMNVSSFFALPNGDGLWPQWDKVMKIQLFIAVTLVAMHSAERIRWLLMVCAASVAFFGIKGGIYTLWRGGGGMVLGPDGGFIEGNTAIALAITMVVPLLRYLQMQSGNRRMRWALGVAMALCAVAVLGTYSRGGLLAVAAMALFLWLKSRNRTVLGIVLALLIPAALTFMPAQWTERMDSISSHEDQSSQGRINAWHFAFNLAKDRPLTGGGFGAFNEQTFTIWAPDPSYVRDAHSIWFQVLGEHGFVGLFLFMLLWFLAWRLAGGIIRSCKGHDDLRWASRLAAMIQVSFIGYWVGGSFLNMAYWDLPYVLLSVLVLTQRWVEQRLAVNEHSRPTGMPLLALETAQSRQGKDARR